jgi:hypothetical protein
MKANGVDAVFRRRSRAEADRLVSEFEQSGLRRKEFCAAHGLSVHSLDAWRRRIAQCGNREKIVPVEIVEDRRAGMGSKPAGGVERHGQFRVLLAPGLRIEVDPGFDAAELRRLIAALDGARMRDCLSQTA